jgi:DNA-binding response OmpR family regulator
MNQSRQRILLVDDDPGILTAIKQTLITNSYEVATATSGVEALTMFNRESPSLILLDLMMPHFNGLEVCRHIRQNSTIPIIILSVKGSEAGIVSVLDLGADDYLVKPFRIAELLARVRAVLRRGSANLSNQVVCGDLEIDTEIHKVTVAGRLVTLTPTEYAVLAELASNAGRVVTTGSCSSESGGHATAMRPIMSKGLCAGCASSWNPTPHTHAIFSPNRIWVIV